jgi:hypothetical protein
MKRRGSTEYKRLQDSVHFIPNEDFQKNVHITNRINCFHELYPHMFIEDVKLGIVPIGGGTYSKKTFSVVLEPSNPDLEKVLVRALSKDDYPRGLSSEVCDFISQCAVELLLFDTSTYEIAYLSKETDRKPIGFEFVHINPFSLTKMGNDLVQILPNDLAAKLGRSTEIRLKPERILTFTLPHRYRSKISELLDLLSVLSTPTSPNFYMEELASGATKTPYDVKAHIFLHKVALAKAAKLSGWNARLLFQDVALEYYLIHRDLVFEQFKIELRDSILATLNEGIARAGQVLGFNTNIVINGLPTTADVRTADDHLQKGDVPFAEVLEPFRSY